MRYEFSPHLRVGERVVYGILDWLGDIGGFLEAEIWIVGVVLFFFSFQPMNIFLIGRLFKFRHPHIDDSDPEKYLKDTRGIVQ